ncbi:MAG: hypothetical protein HEEMFOPI_00717 [Holosporales bacterium]
MLINVLKETPIWVWIVFGYGKTYFYMFYKVNRLLGFCRSSVFGAFCFSRYFENFVKFANRIFIKDDFSKRILDEDDFRNLGAIQVLKPDFGVIRVFSASDGVHLERRSAFGPPLLRHGACNYPPQNFVKQVLTKYGSQSLKTLGETTISHQYTVVRRAGRVAGRIHAGVWFLLNYACLVAASGSHLIRPLKGLPLCFHYIGEKVKKVLTKKTFFGKNEIFFKNKLIRHFFEVRKKMPALLFSHTTITERT